MAFLYEVIELCHTSDKQLNIDCKTTDIELVGPLHECVSEYTFTKGLNISFYSEQQLEAFRELGYDEETVEITGVYKNEHVEFELPEDLEKWPTLGIKWISINSKFLTESVVEYIHSIGLRIGVYFYS